MVASNGWYGTGDEKNNRFRILIVAALVWVALVILEVITSSKEVTDGDYEDFNTASASIHVIFAILLTAS